MAAQTFDSLLKDLKNKVYKPVYFLSGEEPYYIDLISDYIGNHVLSEMEKEFNQTIVYGRDVDMSAVIGMAKRYPMMSNYQVVIIREAQDIKDLFKKKKSSGDDDEGGTDVFSHYLSKPQKSTLLVFCYKYKTVDKRTKAGKVIEKQTVFYESKKLFPDNIPQWIKAYVKSKGYKIKENAAELLAEYLGIDLSKVSNELDKLMINISKDTEIDMDLIEKNIGISKDFNVFELQKAMASRDFLKIARIINYFGANSKVNPFVLSLTAFQGWFNKIITYHLNKNRPGIVMATVLSVPNYYVKDYEQAARLISREAAIRGISLLHEYDLRSKGVNNLNTTENELLKELVYKIMHPASVIIEE